MKLTNFPVTALLLTLFLAAPVTGRAEGIQDELLDSTHDMRALVDLKQETIPNWEAHSSDSLSVVNGLNPFTQGVTGGYTIYDSAPGLDVDSTSHHRVTSLEDVTSED